MDPGSLSQAESLHSKIHILSAKPSYPMDLPIELRHNICKSLSDREVVRSWTVSAQWYKAFSPAELLKDLLRARFRNASQIRRLTKDNGEWLENVPSVDNQDWWRYLYREVNTQLYVLKTMQPT